MREPTFHRALHWYRLNGDGPAMFPERDRRMRQGPVGDLDIAGPLGIEDPDPAEVAGIATDDEPSQAVPPGDPGLDGVT